MYFEHERLEVYTVALAVARRVAKLGGSRALKDQALRAAQSIVLNVAEGASLVPGDAKRNHYRIALGSAGEVAAALDLLDGPADLITDNRRVGQMLGALTRR